MGVIWSLILVGLNAIVIISNYAQWNRPTGQFKFYVFMHFTVELFLELKVREGTTGGMNFTF